jgi:SAM-dependent methyltransferase
VSPIRLPTLLLLGSLLCASCQGKKSQPPPPAKPADPAAPAAAVHDPAHPPIDCPLRKRGVAAGDLRPFAEVEQYIAFLERPDREVWQRPTEVVKALGLEGSEVVVDLGAGSGYFSFRLALAVPDGRVVAIDTEPEMVRHIHHKAMTEKISNLEVELGKPEAPEIPAETDLVFICDVLHHVPDPARWLGVLARQMKPGARLVLIEFKEGQLPEGPPEAAKIPKKRLLELAGGAGLVLSREQADLLPYQTFLVFVKP